MNIRKIIREVLEGMQCPELKVTDQIRSEVMKFDSDEALLRGGGLSIEALDRAAHGFAEGDIKTMNPNQLKVRWRDDLENVEWEVEKSGLSPKKWSEKVDLSTPIDVEYWENEDWPKAFYIADGHHRYYAAKTLGKSLNVNLEIKVNPFKILDQELGYDQYHRCLFKQVHNN